MTTVWRYAKAQAHISWLLPPLWLAAMFGWTFYKHRLPEFRQVGSLFSIFEYFLPLAAAVYLAGVPPFERDEGAAETHLGYPQLPALRLGLLALPPLAAWAATVGAALLTVQLWYLPAQSWTLLKVLAPPTLALTGVALAGAALARHQLGGIVAAFLWWALDAMSRGLFNKQFFLFRASVQTGLFTPEVQGRNIALVGVACLLLAIWVSHRRSHWIR